MPLSSSIPPIWPSPLSKISTENSPKTIEARLQEKIQVKEEFKRKAKAPKERKVFEKKAFLAKAPQSVACKIWLENKKEK